MAAYVGKIEVLDKLWSWAQEVLNGDKIKNKLLLATDQKENTVLHHVTLSGNVQILERIWKWAK